MSTPAFLVGHAMDIIAEPGHDWFFGNVDVGDVTHHNDENNTPPTSDDEEPQPHASPSWNVQPHDQHADPEREICEKIKMWHPLFPDASFRSRGSASAMSQIVGSSFYYPTNGSQETQVIHNLTSLLCALYKDGPKVFTKKFTSQMFKEIASCSELADDLGLASNIIKGYMIARVLKLVPGDYIEFRDLVFRDIDVQVHEMGDHDALYLAYFSARCGMAAFEEAVVDCLLNAKCHRFDKESVKQGEISTAWRLPLGADRLLGVFVSYPRELLQGGDRPTDYTYAKAKFLEQFLSVSRNFVALHNVVLQPWLKGAKTRRNPLRQWTTIGRVIFATKILNNYYSSPVKHPIYGFLKKLAAEFSQEEVAEPQMLSSIFPSKMSIDLTPDTISSVKKEVQDIVDPFLAQSERLTVEAEKTMDEVRGASKRLNVEAADIGKLGARFGQLLDSLGFTDSTGTVDILKGGLSKGVKDGVNASGLGRFIKNVTTTGKSVIEKFSTVLSSLGTLLPYVMIAVFGVTAHYALQIGTWTNRYLWIAVLSGFYLLANKTEVLMGSGLFQTLMSVFSKFGSSPKEKEPLLADDDEPAVNQSFTEIPLSVVATLTMAFTSLGFTDSKGVYGSFKSMCETVQKGGRGLESIISAAITLVTSLAKDIKGWLGIESPVANPAIIGYIDDISEMVATFKSGVAPPSKYLLDRSMALHQVGELYATKFKKEGLFSEEAIVQRQLRTLETMMVDLRKVLCVPTKPRPQPVSVVFDGEPGCGKTILTRFLEKFFFDHELSKMPDDLASALRRVYAERPLSLCYHKGQDFYWDAISPSTMIVTMDDWLQREVMKGGDYAPLMDFIGMANTEPWAPRMAFSKEEKWISPLYVFASTNAKKFADETIKDVDAVYRRIDYHITVSLDKSKIVEGKFSLDAYTLTLNRWIPNSSNEARKGVSEPVREISPVELISRMAQLRQVRAKNANTMETTMSQMMAEVKSCELKAHDADIFVDDDVAENQMNSAGDSLLDPIGSFVNRARSARLDPPERNSEDSITSFCARMHGAVQRTLDVRPVAVPFLSTDPATNDRMYQELMDDVFGSDMGSVVDAFDTVDLESLKSHDGSSFNPYTAEQLGGNPVNVIRQGLNTFDGPLYTGQAIQQAIDGSGLAKRKLDAKKLEKKMSMFSPTSFGLKIKASWEHEEGVLYKLRESFFNIAGGVYMAVIKLVEFMRDNGSFMTIVVSTVLAGLGLKYFFGNDEEAVNESASTFSHVRSLRLQRRPDHQGPRPAAINQMGSERFKNVRDKLRGNMYELYGPTLEGTMGTLIGTVNGVCDRVFHCPNHFLLRTAAQWKAAGLKDQHKKFFFKKGDEVHVVPLSEVVILSEEEDNYVRDRVIFQVQAPKGITLPMCANVLTHYVTDVEIGEARYRGGSKFPTILFDREQMLDPLQSQYKASKKVRTAYGATPGVVLEEDVDVRELFEYVATTKQGDCGALLMSVDSTTARVMGTHMAGSSRIGFSYRITSDEIKRVIYGKVQDGTISKSDVPDYQITVGAEDPTVVVSASSYNLAVHEFPVDYHMQEKGSVFTNPHLVKYTGNGEDYVEFDQAVTDTSPAAYERAREPYCKRIDESEAKQKDYAVQLEACADAVAQDLLGLDWDRSHRLYSYKETIVGMDGTDFKGIDFGTSSGWPWMNRGVKKTSVGTYVEGDFYIGKQYLPMYQKVDSIIQDLAVDTIPEIVYQDTLKVEWRTMAKANTPRMVSAAPLDAVLAGRCLFGSFMHFMRDTCLKNETLIGFNPYGEANAFALQMLRFGNNKNFACADYKGFDTDHTTRMMMLAARIINKVCGGNKFVQNARTNYIWSVANSRHVRGSVMEQWPGSMPSGNVLTAIINCLINMINVRFIWLRANNYQLSCLPKFQANVVFRCLGDDNAVAVSSEYRAYFSEKYQAETVALIGYRMTSATKGAELKDHMTDFEEVELLKRVPRWDVDRCQWVLPLRLSVVLYMPMKTKKDNYLGIAKDNLETAFHELSLHDPKIWDEWSPKMIKYCCDFRPTSEKRHYYLDRVLEQGYYDPELWC